jgi:hypothetical protein
MTDDVTVAEVLQYMETGEHMAPLGSLTVMSAEVRRLRAKLARVGALPKMWLEGMKPTPRPGEYGAGRDDQARACAYDLQDALKD